MFQYPGESIAMMFEVDAGKGWGGGGSVDLVGLPLSTYKVMKRLIMRKKDKGLITQRYDDHIGL